MTPETAQSSAPGSVVGGYRIESFVAVGGFGVVYRARAPDGRTVAIKIAKLPATLLSARELLLQQNEIEALIRLKHPSLVEVLDYGFEGDGRMYLVMEYVEGTVLKSYLAQRGALDVLEATRICRRIAEALAYCHESNVLHLDLKPGNIIIADPYEPKIKVLDFGLARLTGGFRKGGSGGLAGTLEYMAPECFGGGDPLSPRVDLYALGTLYYEMLAGGLPYPVGLGLAAFIEHRKLIQIPPLDEVAPRVPRPVVALVRSLLAAEPAHRFSSASALTARLKALCYDTLQADAAEGAQQDPSAGDAELEDREAPFVGRGAELGALCSALEGVSAGEARALAIMGEAGIGKSRLVSEGLAGPEAAGMLVGYGRCRPLGELVPYSPLREALGHLAALLEDLAADLPELHRRVSEALVGEGEPLFRLVPELAHLSSQGRPDAAGEGAILQGMGAELVARALSHFLSRLAEVRKVVLVIEDVHWADAGTLAVLGHLAGSLAPRGTLLLLTGRPSAALPQSPRLGSLVLEPLVPEESSGLLSMLLGGAPPEVIAALLEAVPVLGTGNPLACAQIARDLLVEGYLTRDAAGALLLSPLIREQYRPPGSISAVFERALERMAASVLQVLRVAARIDRQFRASDLAALGLYTAEQVHRALEISVQEKLVMGSGDRFSFVHDTLREKLAGSVPAADLPDMHRRIAQRLEERGASSGTLGYHLEQAGQPLAAAHAYLRAGLEADELHDPAGASNHLRRAFGLLAELPASAERDDLLVRALHELVRVSCLFGAAGGTLTLLEKGSALLAARTPAQQLAIDSAYARMHYAQANFRTAMEYSERCLKISASDPALRKYRYIPSSVIGRAMAGAGKFGPALPVLAEAYQLALEAGEYVEQTHNEGIMAVALGFCGEFDRAREHARSAMQLARRLGDAVRTAAGYFYTATIAEAQCRWEEGVRGTKELLRYAEEQGLSGLYLVVGTVYAGRHQFHVGRLDRARLLLQGAMKLCQQSGTQFGLPSAHAFLGDVELVAQQYDHARLLYTEGLRLSNAAADELAAALCLIGQAHLEALTGGALEQVRQLADEAVRRFTEVSNVTALAIAHQRYAEALEALGREDLAAPWRERWRQYARERQIAECDFWPRPPDGDSAELTRREYWRTAPSRAPSRPLPMSDSSAETLVRSPASSNTPTGGSQE